MPRSPTTSITLLAHSKRMRNGYTSYRFRRGGRFSSFALEKAEIWRDKQWEKDEQKLAEARPRAFYTSYVVDYQGMQYTLRPSWPLRFPVPRSTLSADSEKAGSIYLDSLSSKSMTADLPVRLPLSVRVFMLWLVLVFLSPRDGS